MTFARGKRSIVFDTSGLNSLLDDSERDCFVAGLKSGYHVRLTANSISEIVATSNSERRKRLLDLCCRFLSTGFCLCPFHNVITRVCAPFARPGTYDWKLADIRFPECEEELIRREFITDHLSAEERAANSTLEAEFRDIFDRSREHFQKLFADGEGPRPKNLSELVYCLQSGGAFWTIANDMYERGTGQGSLDDASVRELVAVCPPFHALVLAFCMAQYERCIRAYEDGVSYRAGRIDLLTAVFLPYCEVFITDEQRQRRCLAEIASVGKFPVEVMRYGDFKESFNLDKFVEKTL